MIKDGGVKCHIESVSPGFSLGVPSNYDAPPKVEKRRRAVAAIQNLLAYDLHMQAVAAELSSPLAVPDPEDLMRYSKREWERSIQLWRDRVEDSAVGGHAIAQGVLVHVIPPSLARSPDISCCDF